MPTVRNIEDLRHRHFHVKGGQASNATSTEGPDHHHRDQQHRQPEHHHHNLPSPTSKKRRRPSDIEVRSKKVKSCSPDRPLYTDVLLQPELLKEIKGHEDLAFSSNPLLEFCLDVGSKRVNPAEAKAGEETRRPLPPLLRLCSSSSFDHMSLLDLVKLCQDGNLSFCDINVRDTGNGFSAVHHLIQSCTKDSFLFSLHGIYILMSLGLSPVLEDHRGNTALTLLHVLLQKELFNEATMIAHVLYSAKCDINHVNKSNRSLLSYSITYGDLTAPLTRLLLNVGAKVCPSTSSSPDPHLSLVEQLSLEREQSAFTWFLKSLMEDKIRLDESCSKTVYLLGTAMGDEPRWMKEHVCRTMIQLGHNARALGPLFNSLKQKLTPFWTRPQPLKFLCLKQIRHSIGPKNLSDEGRLRSLDIPYTMMQFLQLF